MPRISKNILDRIHEVHYITGSEPELDLLIYNENASNPSYLDYTWMVYIDLDNTKELIAYQYSSHSWKGRSKKTFVQCLHHFDEFNLQNLTFLCTFYTKTNDKGLDMFDARKTCNFLKPFTNYTFGWIAYHSQGWNLFQLLTGCSEIEAKQWLRDMNDGELIAKANAMVIDIGETTLLEIWDTYTLLKQTVPTKVKQGEVLYKFLYSEILKERQ